MSGAESQAAGLAVGAAVGSIVPGAGTVVGAKVGAGLGLAVGSVLNSQTQAKSEMAALRLNQEAAHARAADLSARHAANFRQALASQVSLASMRGGSGSLAAQFGSQAMQSFTQDQRSIAIGESVADTQAAFGKAGVTAKEQASNILAAGQAISAFDPVNFNKLASKAT